MAVKTATTERRSAARIRIPHKSLLSNTIGVLFLLANEDSNGLGNE